MQESLSSLLTHYRSFWAPGQSIRYARAHANCSVLFDLFRDWGKNSRLFRRLSGSIRSWQRSRRQLIMQNNSVLNSMCATTAVPERSCHSEKHERNPARFSGSAMEHVCISYPIFLLHTIDQTVSRGHASALSCYNTLQANPMKTNNHFLESSKIRSLMCL